MTHPSIHARTTPNKIAYRMAGTGKAITYRELDELSNQGAHLFPLARPQSRRPYRAADGKPPRLHGDLLGRAAQRTLLHRHQPLPEAGRDRLHREGLRRQGRHHHAEMRRPDQGPDQGHGRRADLLHDGRSAARLPLLRQGSRRAADHADCRRGRRLRHAVFLGHHWPPEGESRRLSKATRSTYRTPSCACSAPTCAA